MSTSAYLRIGELLVAEGILSEEQLDEALAWRSKTKSRFGEVLTELGFVREDHVISALAKQFDHPVVDLSTTTPTPEALSLISQEFAIANLCLPLDVKGDVLFVAISDPLDIHTIDALTAQTKMWIQIQLATPSDIKRAVIRSYVSKSHKRQKPRTTKRQKDRDHLLELFAKVEPWKSGKKEAS